MVIEVSQMDHLLIVLIAIVYPVYSSVLWFRRDRIRLEARETKALVNYYRNNIFELWFLSLLILAWWFREKRAFAEIGLDLPGGWKFWMGLIVFVLVAVFLVRQMLSVRTSKEARAQLLKQLTGNVALIVPRNDIERRLAIWVSLTAGICEELLYRAFFMWYLMNWLPGYGAVGVSALIFGIAHIYQGVTGAVKALLAGIIFGFAYILTGTLWVPIALHATIDITSLLTSSIALTMTESEKGNGESD